MPLFMIEGSKDGGLFSEAITASNIDDAERAAVIRLCEAWGEEGGELSDLGDAAHVYEFGPSDYARNAADEMLSTINTALPLLSAVRDSLSQWGHAGTIPYGVLDQQIQALSVVRSIAYGEPFTPSPSANEPDPTPLAQIAAPPAELPAGVTFNEANLETSMCLWEAMLEIRDRPDVAARFNDVGTVAMRHAVMTLITDCEREWEALGDEQEQHAPYDWEWCPRFLERNLSRLGVEMGEG